MSLIFATHSSGVPENESFSTRSGVVSSIAFSTSPLANASKIGFCSAGSMPCALELLVGHRAEM